MRQRRCLNHLHLQSAKPPVNYTCFYKHSDHIYHWLLAACNEKYLQSQVRSPLSRLPSLSVIQLSLMYAAADLFALPHNGSALQLKLLYTLSTISQIHCAKNVYSHIFCGHLTLCNCWTWDQNVQCCALPGPYHELCFTSVVRYGKQCGNLITCAEKYMKKQRGF